MRSLPSIIANTIGNMVAEGLAGKGRRPDDFSDLGAPGGSLAPEGTHWDYESDSMDQQRLEKAFGGTLRLASAERSISDRSDIVVTARKMSWFDKFLHDVTHPVSTLGRIFGAGSGPRTFDTSGVANSISMTLRRAGGATEASPAMSVGRPGRYDISLAHSMGWDRYSIPSGAYDVSGGYAFSNPRGSSGLSADQVLDLTLQPGFAGIAFGISRQMGASTQTQMAIAGTVAAIDGIAAARAGMPGRLAAESEILTVAYPKNLGTSINPMN